LSFPPSAINIDYLIKHIFLDCFKDKLFGEKYVVIRRLAGIFYYIPYVIKAADVINPILSSSAQETVTLPEIKCSG